MRTIIRALLVLVLIAVIGVLLLNYWPAGFSLGGRPTSSPEAGAGSTERARERAADIGEKAAVATKKIQENLAEGGITAKIKAKMALDDSLKSGDISVSTEGTTVTVSGTVPTGTAHERAMALARETAGVTAVVDHLKVVPAR
jgi:osmotically-inducible protein OsmY